LLFNVNKSKAGVLDLVSLIFGGPGLLPPRFGGIPNDEGCDEG
jgi:hypothetical protein